LLEDLNWLSKRSTGIVRN